MIGFHNLTFEDIEHLCHQITDENECNRVNNDCKDVNTKTWKQGVTGCKDTVGSYDCVCASGFTYNSTSRVCTGKSRSYHFYQYYSICIYL